LIRGAKDQPWVTGQKQRRKAIRQVAETCSDQQDTPGCGGGTRFKYKNPEGEKPQASKDPGDTESLSMQIKELHGQGLPLRLWALLVGQKYSFRKLLFKTAQPLLTLAAKYLGRHRARQLPQGRKRLSVLA
jgi:hypothetical protein